MASSTRLDDVTRGVFVAWRLFFWDKQAIALIDDSRSGALKSFWCALVILPLVFVNWALQSATPSKVPGNFGVLVEQAGLSRTLAVLAIFYVIGWAAWPVIMYWLASLLNCGRFYFRYLGAFNWSATIVIGLKLFYTVVNFMQVAPPDALVVVSLALLTAMWVYHWFILRNTLEINGGFAAVLVAAHFMLSVIIDKISTATVL